MKWIIPLMIVLAMIFLASNVQGAWWDFWTNCEDGVPPDHECEFGELMCTQNGQKIMECGDYDDDRCLEFAFGTNYGLTCEPVTGILGDIIWIPCKTCPYGCKTQGGKAVCYLVDPCADWGDACIQGQTRCGGVAELGTLHSFVVSCGYDDNFGCWVWGAGISVQDCPYGCADGKCLDQNELLNSECVPGQYQCLAILIRPCVQDEFHPGWYRWSTNPNDYISCQHGCVNTEYGGVCVTEEGETQFDECNVGQWRCNPDYPDYLQPCWDTDDQGNKQWTTDLERNSYCRFGCHASVCKPDPEPDVPTCDEVFGCYEGQTRCYGTGDSVIGCGYDSATDCWIWSIGQITKCLSGICQNGQCSPLTGFGYKFNLTIAPIYNDDVIDLDIIQDDVGSHTGSDLTWNDKLGRLVVSGHNSTTVIGPYVWRDFIKYYVYSKDGDFIKNEFITDQVYDMYGNASYLGNDSLTMGIDYYNNYYYVVWIEDYQAGGPHNYSILKLNEQFEVTDRFLNVTTRLFVFIGGIAVNENYIYIHECCDGGINIYYRNNGTYIDNFCLVSETSILTECSSTKHLFIEVTDDKLYASFRNDTLDNKLYIQIYGITESDLGYYYGNFVPTEQNEDIEVHGGIEKIGNDWYIGHPYLTDSSAFFRNYVDDYIIEVMYDVSFCDNECYKGGSRCIDTGINGWIQKCVQNEWGCWRYYDGTFETNETDPQIYCGAFNCHEQWLNHKIKVAYCGTEPICNHICNTSETKCDITERYVMHCVNEPLTGWDGVSCRRWDDKGRWTKCPLGTGCINGRCEIMDICTVGETRCIKGFEVFPEFFTSKDWFVQYCDDIEGDGYYEWNPFNMTYCALWCNETSVDNVTGLPCNASSTKCLRKAECDEQAAQMYGDLQESGFELMAWLDIVFQTEASKYLLIIILMVITTATIGLLAESWELGLISGSTWLLIGSITGFISPVVIALFAVMTTFILYRMVFSE